jgi:hypothetical protein
MAHGLLALARPAYHGGRPAVIGMLASVLRNFARRRHPRRRASLTAGTCLLSSLRRKHRLPPPTPLYNSRKRRKRRRRRCLPGCGSWARVQLLSSYDSPIFEHHEGDRYSNTSIVECWRIEIMLTEVIGPRSTRRNTEIRRWRGRTRARILQRRLRAKDDTKRSRADTRDAVRPSSTSPTLCHSHFHTHQETDTTQRTRHHKRTPPQEAPLTHAAKPPRSRR